MTIIRSAAGLLILLCACAASIESADLPRTPSQSLPPATDSCVGRVFAFDGAPDESLFATLDHGDDGLDARLALVSSAMSSIDAQSYLWHTDGSGSLLLDQIMVAADRGVRVRLLIDGFRLEGNEDLDVALSLHPMVEIRVFNPTLHRGGVWRVLELIEHVDALDHRMHNKLFLVDGCAAVLGGRNIGDEYFGLGEDLNMRDFDLLAAGAVIADLARSFDDSWNSEWSIPLDDLIVPKHQAASAHRAARRTLEMLHIDIAHLDGRRAVEPDEWLDALRRARSGMFTGRAEVLHDSSKIGQKGATGIMAKAFEGALERSNGDALLVTAYLVPSESLLTLIRDHAATGARVQILTNSYTSTNQPIAHAYYAATRRDLIEAGAELYEMRADAWSDALDRSPGSQARALGLHAKSIVLGDRHVIVGSMNLDPRSMVLNMEMGVLVESSGLASRVRAALERGLAERNAWRVTLDESGELHWSSEGVELSRDPGLTTGEAIREWFIRLLPLRGEV